MAMGLWIKKKTPTGTGTKGVGLFFLLRVGFFGYPIIFDPQPHTTVANTQVRTSKTTKPSASRPPYENPLALFGFAFQTPGKKIRRQALLEKPRMRCSKAKPKKLEPNFNTKPRETHNQKKKHIKHSRKGNTQTSLTT